MLRLIIAAAFPTPRAGLRAILAEDTTFNVVASVEDTDALLVAIDDHAPDVVVIDLIDETDGWLVDLDAAGEAEALPPMVLILGSTRSALTAMTIPRASLLLRDATVDEMHAAVRTASAGLIALDPRVAAEIGQQAASRDVPTPLDANVTLTQRELQVIGAIARGLPNKAIAAELGISEHTVKFHIGSIFQKLGAASRSEALAVAARNGLIAL